MLTDNQTSCAKLSRHETAILWITGYSSAGKTTVARKVKLLLEEMGIKAVLLDGDDLRGIFAGKWGYDRIDRIELAHAYFRLCSTLSAQGITVIISAVAMYNEIYTWVRTNVDRAVQIYLKVPQTERVVRDKATKNIYESIGNIDELYDEPSFSDIVIENYGLNTPDVAAQMIIDAYRNVISQSGADKGRTEHWNGYYKGTNLIFEPSNFAISVAKEFDKFVNILEIGCGNGRDAVYFAKSGNKVMALDPSIEAINLCQTKYNVDSVQFMISKLPEIESFYNSTFDVIYSRFCFHAMTDEEEMDNLKAAYKVLKPSGRIFIECRSINDPLSRKGEVISPTERIYGHYRRFIVMDEMKRRMANIGFKIDHAIESNNLAVLEEDNPVIIRIYARK